jgi:hypothetical protein
MLFLIQCSLTYGASAQRYVSRSGGYALHRVTDRWPGILPGSAYRLAGRTLLSRSELAGTQHVMHKLLGDA